MADCSRHSGRVSRGYAIGSSPLEARRRTDAEGLPALRQRLAQLDERSRAAVDDAALPLAEAVERLGAELALFRQSLTAGREARARAARDAPPARGNAASASAPSGMRRGSRSSRPAATSISPWTKARPTHLGRAAARGGSRGGSRARGRARRSRRSVSPRRRPRGRECRRDRRPRLRSAAGSPPSRRCSGAAQSRTIAVIDGAGIVAFAAAGLMVAAGLLMRNWPLVAAALAPLAVGVLLVAGRDRTAGNGQAEYLAHARPRFAAGRGHARRHGRGARRGSARDRRGGQGLDGGGVGDRRGRQGPRTRRRGPSAGGRRCSRRTPSRRTTEPVSVRQVLREVRQAQQAHRDAAAVEAEAERRRGRMRATLSGPRGGCGGRARGHLAGRTSRRVRRDAGARACRRRADAARTVARQEQAEVRDRLEELEARLAEAAARSGRRCSPRRVRRAKASRHSRLTLAVVAEKTGVAKAALPRAHEGRERARGPAPDGGARGARHGAAARAGGTDRAPRGRARGVRGHGDGAAADGGDARRCTSGAAAGDRQARRGDLLGR